MNWIPAIHFTKLPSDSWANRGRFCSMCSFMTVAVQHERGPRKPKHHQHHGKDLHHHHHHHHHVGSPPALGGVPVLQAPPDGASSATAKLLFPGAVAPPVKPPAIAGATTAADHAAVPPPPPAAAMFLAHQPPPPGLLQILMSAEKCQVHKLYNLLTDPPIRTQDFGNNLAETVPQHTNSRILGNSKSRQKIMLRMYTTYVTQQDRFHVFISFLPLSLHLPSGSWK